MYRYWLSFCKCREAWKVSPACILLSLRCCLLFGVARRGCRAIHLAVLRAALYLQLGKEMVFVHFLVMSVVSLIIRVIISQRYSYCIIHLLFPPVSVLTKNWRLSACFIQVIYHLFTCYCSLIYECIFFLLIRIFVGYLFCIVLHLWCIWPFIRISIIYVPWTVLHLCMYLFTHSHFNYLFALNCSSYMLVIFVYSFAF